MKVEVPLYCKHPLPSLDLTQLLHCFPVTLAGTGLGQPCPENGLGAAYTQKDLSSPHFTCKCSDGHIQWRGAGDRVLGHQAVSVPESGFSSLSTASAFLPIFYINC